MIVYPALEPVYVLKSDISYGFYHIAMQPADAPKLGLVFPLDGQREELVSIFLTLPMVWKNYPPIFCTPTETVVGLKKIPALKQATPTTKTGQPRGSGSHS